MSEWRLVNCGNQPSEEGDPTIVVESAVQLAECLERFRQGDPRIVNLDSPGRETLIIGIGGPLGALSWVKSPVDVFCRIAVPARSFSDVPVDFRDAGDSAVHEIGPDRLFPIEEVIRGVIFFYENALLPDWMNWKVWNPITREWEFCPKDEV